MFKYIYKGHNRAVMQLEKPSTMKSLCESDGPLTCVELYLEYNRKIFQLILHRDHVHYLTRSITPSQVQYAHVPACKAVTVVSVAKLTAKSSGSGQRRSI